jgi:antitoxin (DNA-binding transcriptional repressor) of toxin-antitoxin stability system
MKITVEGRTVATIVTHNRQFGADRSRDITISQRRDGKRKDGREKGETNQ